MVRTLSITWWNLADGSTPSAEHESELTLLGLRHAHQMVRADFTSGELLGEVDGIGYRGHWQLTQ